MTSSHPEILQCAVVGVKVDGAGGEDEVMACVVRSSVTLDAKTLLDWCVPRMPRVALPRYIQFVDDIERTASGKIASKRSARPASHHKLGIGRLLDMSCRAEHGITVPKHHWGRPGQPPAATRNRART